MRPLVLHISGMSCGHCLNAVQSALAGTSGVSVRTVRIGRADVDYDEGTVTPGAIVAAVGKAGYAATAQPAAGPTND